MEIQEPSPRLLISALRFETVSPWLLDRRGELISRMSKKYDLPEWLAQQDLVQLSTSDSRRLFQMSSRDVYVSLENFEDLTEAIGAAEGFISDALDALEVDRITWTGTRMHWLAAADSFDQLCAWFAYRSRALTGALSDILNRSPSDVGLVLEYKDKDPLITVRVGPMRAEQAMAQLFRDKDVTHYPEQFLFLDLDRVHSEDRLKRPDALSQWRQRVDSLTKIGDALLRSVTNSR